MATPLAVAVVAIGRAVQLNNGAFTPEAFHWIAASVACSVAAISFADTRFVKSLGELPVVTVLGVALAYQFGAIFSSPPGIYLHPAVDGNDTHHYAVAVGAVLAGAGLSVRPWLGRWRMPLLLATYAFLGRWLIAASPSPRIDVYAFHEEAFRALAKHLNPYAIPMPNIYGHTMWYAEGFATATQVLVGFLYPPLSLFLTWLGHLAGDYRYATLAAVVGAAGLMTCARRGRLGSIVAAVFLFTPRGLFVLEQGWTEPLVVFFVAATVFSAVRAPRALPWSLGLLLAVKQYCIFFLPISGLLLGSRWSWKEQLGLVAKSGAVAAAVTLPMALWKPRAFIESVVVFQGRQPMRTDSLSYAAWRVQNGHAALPGWTSFALALLATVFCLWRAPRTPAGFAASGSFILLVFFAFAKQAFCNYYFMVLGAMCCAVAALSASSNDVASIEPPVESAAPRVSTVPPNASSTP
jgi:hypothetical protein